MCECAYNVYACKLASPVGLLLTSLPLVHCGGRLLSPFVLSSPTLSPITEQVLQKYTGYLDSTMQSRLSGFFSGQGDEHREWVPTWEAVDQSKEIQAKQELMKSMAEVEKVHAAGKAEEAAAKASDEAAVAAEAGKAAGKAAEAAAADAADDAKRDAADAGFVAQANEDMGVQKAIVKDDAGNAKLLLLEVQGGGGEKRRQKRQKRQQGTLAQHAEGHLAVHQHQNQRQQQSAATVATAVRAHAYGRVAAMARAMSTMSRTSQKLDAMVGAATRESSYQVGNTRRIIQRHRKWRRAALESKMIEQRMHHRAKRAALQIRRGQPKEEVHSSALAAAAAAREASKAIAAAADANWGLAKMLASTVAAEARVASSTAAVLRKLQGRSRFCQGRCKTVALAASKAATEARSYADTARTLTQNQPRVVLEAEGGGHGGGRKGKGGSGRGSGREGRRRRRRGRGRGRGRGGRGKNKHRRDRKHPGRLKEKDDDFSRSDMLVEVDTRVLSTAAVGAMTDAQLLAMSDVEELSLIEEESHSMASTTAFLHHSEDIGARGRVRGEGGDAEREMMRRGERCSVVAIHVREAGRWIVEKLGERCYSCLAVDAAVGVRTVVCCG